MFIRKYGHFVVALLLLFSFSTVQAADVNLLPLSGVRFVVAPGSTKGVVKYVIFNSSATASYNLVLKPIKGLAAQAGIGYCGTAFTLAKKKSCLLILKINAAKMANPTKGGPVLCRKENAKICFTPIAKDQLNLIRDNVVSFKALSSVKLTVPSNRTAKVYYQVLNLKRDAMQLKVKAIPGIQSLGGISGSVPYCGNNFKLGKTKSCLLVLQITGSKIAKTIKTGPYICIKGTSKCYQPLPGKRLTITKGVATGLATIEAQELFPLSVAQGASVLVHIKNTSPVPAKGIAVMEVPTLTCPTLAQNGVCTLHYTAAATMDLGTYPFTVKGSNTNTIYGQVVITSGGNTSLAPVIESIVPDHGAQQGGIQITVTGQNLQPKAQLYLGNNLCTDVMGDSTVLTAIVPQADCLGVNVDTPVDVKITTDNGEYTYHNGFTYLAAAPTCSDGTKNGLETDIDCGGTSCSPCADGQSCRIDTDCHSGSCMQNMCQQVCTSVWYLDADNDGYGNDSQSLTACAAPTGYVASGGDCDDANPAVNPGATENCNSLDDNCNGLVDENVTGLDDGNECTADQCAAGVPFHLFLPLGSPCNQNGGTQCDGSGACITPAPTCSDSIKNGDETDVDCGGGTCQACVNGGVCLKSSDCVSSNCVGNLCQQACTSVWYLDADRDGYGNASQNVTACAAPTGYVASGGDCDDANPAVKPGATEICNSLDDNCNGQIDDGVPSSGSCTAGIGACQRVGTMQCTSGVMQCSVFPGTPSQETCNGIDDNCNGSIDEGGVCIPPPTVSSLTPSFGSTTGGTTVTITGTNLTGATGVSFGGTPGTNITNNTGTSLQVTVPVHAAGDVQVTVTTPEGTSTDVVNFTYQSPPTVTSTTPTSGSSVLASSPISVAFSIAMNPATLTGQTSAGACSGSIQVSADNFTSCIAFSSASATMTDGNTVATLTPAPGLLVNRSYAVRVTTTAAAANMISLASQFDGSFSTTSPDTFNGSIVISQIYTAGGNIGAAYRNDYVVLHNRGRTAVNLSGKSLQYASATGTTWTTFALNGIIQGGGYFLVQLASVGSNGSVLPTPDAATGGINMNTASGKVALMNTTTSNSSICPDTNNVIDFIGYGPSVNCAEGTATVALSASTAAIRNQNGCVDTGVNNVDFTVSFPSPKNSSTTKEYCGAYSVNGSNLAQEADYCTIEPPYTLTVQTGVSTGDIYGQIYEATVTEASGANSNVLAQIGYGPASSNPEYEAGWTWINATYNQQLGNVDEYRASFTAPAPGTYAYVYRFSLDNGASWTVCGTNGAGSTFNFADEGVLTVTP